MARYVVTQDIDDTLIRYKFSVLLTAKPRLDSRRKEFDHCGDLVSVRRIYPNKTMSPRWRFDSYGTCEFFRIQSTTRAFTEKVLFRLCLSTHLRTRGKNQYLVRHPSEYDGKQTSQSPHCYSGGSLHFHGIRTGLTPIISKPTPPLNCPARTLPQIVAAFRAMMLGL